MEDYEALKSSLVSIASELFRFRQVFERVLSGYPLDVQNKYISQYNWFSKRVEKALDVANMKVVDLSRKEFDPGMPVTAVNLDDFSPEDRLYIEQMIEPVVMENNKVIKAGTVILGRFEE